MTNFISVQLKKASEVDLAKPLCKFIQQSYPGGDAQAEHCRAAEELSKLRKNALGRPLDKHDACLDTLLRSWRTGEVLEDSRIANVTPVFMKGKKEDPGNYRPVSPLSLERCWNIQNDFCFLSSILQRFDSQTGDAGPE
ncbi:programmed cell death 6-interacting protein-like isoform X2 [Anas acuta]|uniref:programmed cell death 6-interacting protein-like isoform X2 n=1 Tax=Anas acuta TaxID=28680 RepID=UPI0035C9141C